MKDGCAKACDKRPNECKDAVPTGECVNLQILNRDYEVVIGQITNVVTQKKRLEEKEKSLKDKLKEAMEKHAVKSLDNDLVRITYVAATTATGIDSKVLKSKYPDIAAKCSKTSNKSAYIKIEVK
ncbi:MAG: hypothetical protein RSF13_08865 [Clostridiales bacterium]